MSTRHIASALFVLTTLGPGAALAADGGFYIGGGVGQATLKDGLPNGSNFDESDTAWKAFAGYRIGCWIPLLDVAGELTYRDFGNPDGKGASFDAHGYDASVLGIVTLGPIDLFLRGGVGNYDVERKFNGSSNTDTSTSPLYGVGAGFRIWKVNVRAEWERVQPDNTDHIDMYTINAYWRF